MGLILQTNAPIGAAYEAEQTLVYHSWVAAAVGRVGAADLRLVVTNHVERLHQARTLL